MKIPVKINPDRIKEAVVEARYISFLPFDVLPGICFRAFDDSYTYIDKPLKVNNSTPPPVLVPGKEFKFQVGNKSILYNDKITIEILPNSFVFNCLNEYIGWNSYFLQIQKAIGIISSAAIVAQWVRVGTRYISQYENVDLRDYTKFDFYFGHPGIKSRMASFKSEFDYDNCKVILNLKNMAPVVKSGTSAMPEIIPTSVIDVDVIRDGIQISVESELLDAINLCHKIEKEIYFGMLKEDFLKTLNPEY